MSKETIILWWISLWQNHRSWQIILPALQRQTWWGFRFSKWPNKSKLTAFSEFTHLHNIRILKSRSVFLLGKLEIVRSSWQLCLLYFTFILNLYITQVNITNHFVRIKYELDHPQDRFYVFHMQKHPTERQIAPEATQLVLDDSFNSQASPVCNNRLAEQILKWI